jgi:hypothetical protein
LSNPQRTARPRWRPDSTDEELLADLDAARAEHGEDSFAASAPEMTPGQAADIARLLDGAA